MPSRDVRLDQIDHMPLWTTRQRCKVPECNGRSHVECQKCKAPGMAVILFGKLGSRVEYGPSGGSSRASHVIDAGAQCSATTNYVWHGTCGCLKLF
ncbi:hypothetical protein EVAR_39960_1 [Eumeta japonica]|uniref:Uncharacterized protein n=1 Tax=Eumeta variegata TaxID=151549 RepID=A0A4C1X0W8_EUMVA|nr:hypothetical protein EVAR_39960_1 [Eumeta japonica]